MKNIMVLVLIALSVSAFGQKIKLVEGNLKPLKGEKAIETTFKYDNMTIGKDGLTEADYVAKKKKEYDAKEAGRGERFETAWFGDRANRFAPRFNELFGKYAKVSTKGPSKYTLIFHTDRTEPGWNVGVMRAAARIDGVVFIVESANPSNVIAKFTVVNAPGKSISGYDYATGDRLQECYAKTGKEIGKMIAAAK